MPLLENEKAVKDYFDEVKDKYPGIDFEHFRIICRSPFIFIRNLIRDGELPRILVKYLGKFRVFPAKVKEQIKKEKIFFEKNITTEEQFTASTNFLTTKLKEINEDLAKDTDDETQASD